MDTTVASALAKRAHLGQTDRFGGRVIDHVARVAAAVPPDARSVAWLHDLLERTGTGVESLRGDGLSELEESALDLLTRQEGEDYEIYVLRVAFADGEAGRLARAVKRADLEDHIAFAPRDAAAPPYAWARQHIGNAQWRNHEPVAAGRPSSLGSRALPAASGM